MANQPRDLSMTNQEINDLNNLLLKYAESYYRDGVSIVDDQTYDRLYRTLEAQLDKQPNYRPENCILDQVGGSLLPWLEKKELFTPMLSLSNTTEEDNLAFIDSINKQVGEAVVYSVEPKFDGLTLETRHLNGKLISGITRGDGSVGEDVTENIHNISDIPTYVPVKELLVTQGEVYLPRQAFNKINQQRTAIGLAPYKTPRNAASGILRCGTVKSWAKGAVPSSSVLRYFPFNCVAGIDLNVSQSQLFGALETLGFSVASYNKVFTKKPEISDWLLYLQDLRPELPYDIDGAVIKVNDRTLREQLGTTTKYPKWAIAYKFPPEEGETVIKEIVNQVGSTGTITPVAILEPVCLGGVEITRATLHNYDLIRKKDLRVGDVVRICRAQDVIPKVLRAVTEKRGKDVTKPKLPTNCPSCGSTLTKLPGDPTIKCTNTANCPAQFKELVKRAVSRTGLNIMGIGERIVEELIDTKQLTKLSDLVNPKTYSGIGGKLQSNILKSLRKASQTTLTKFIFSLGIPGVGIDVANKLSLHFTELSRFVNAEATELLLIEGVGPNTTKSIVDYLGNQVNQNTINELAKLLTLTKEVRGGGRLSNLSFVITGSFEGVSRDTITKLIKDNGGTVTKKVTKRTNYLVEGNNGGSNVGRALKLKVKSITLEELNKLIN